MLLCANWDLVVANSVIPSTSNTEYNYHGFKINDTRATISLIFMSSGFSYGCGAITFSFDRSSGLNKVYVFKNLVNVTVKFYRGSNDDLSTYVVFATPNKRDEIRIIGFTCGRNNITDYKSNTEIPTGATELTQENYS